MRREEFKIVDKYCEKEKIDLLKSIKEEIEQDRNDYHECGWAYDDVLEIINKRIEQLGTETKEDMTSSHSEKQIYDGCISLMQRLVGQIKEWLEIIGVDLDKMDSDEWFYTEFSPTEIVETLFLQHTTHSGYTSRRLKCEELGLDVTDDAVYFEINGNEEE